MNILITGATGDIGYETSKYLSEYHDLILVGKTSLDRLKELSKLKRVKQTISCDITNYREVVDKISDIEVDAYVHVAGISQYGLIQDTAIDEWHKVMDTNINSIFYITKSILPNMINKKSGKIILVSSIWGKVGASMEVAYSTSKGAVDAFTKALAKEVAPSGISVNSLNLGLVDTKMNNHISCLEMKNLCDEIPFGRAASPKECAIFIKNILDMPSYMTGQNIGFDGAW